MFVSANGRIINCEIKDSHSFQHPKMLNTIDKVQNLCRNCYIHMINTILNSLRT